MAFDPAPHDDDAATAAGRPPRSPSREAHLLSLGAITILPKGLKAFDG
jgi:hypothetical protein